MSGEYVFSLFLWESQLQMYVISFEMIRYPWKMNGAGFLFNHLFGYGVMDAGSLVDAALSWKVVQVRFLILIQLYFKLTASCWIAVEKY